MASLSVILLLVLVTIAYLVIQDKDAGSPDLPSDTSMAETTIQVKSDTCSRDEVADNQGGCVPFRLDRDFTNLRYRNYVADVHYSPTSYKAWLASTSSEEAQIRNLDYTNANPYLGYR